MSVINAHKYEHKMVKRMSNTHLAIEETTEDQCKKNDNFQWNNSDNDHFYGHVAPQGLMEFSKKAGLETSCDLELLNPIINESSSILEVGAGYGRVIKYLLDNNFKGEITAIERNASMFQHLKNNYGNYATLLNLDIFHCEQIQERFDLILYLWLGIADFPALEQEQVISKLKKLLNPNGKLVIDTMPDETLLLQSEQLDQKTFLLTTDNSQVYIRKPHEEDIRAYAMTAGFLSVDKRPYFTTTGRERMIYILS